MPLLTQGWQAINLDANDSVVISAIDGAARISFASGALAGQVESIPRGSWSRAYNGPAVLNVQHIAGVVDWNPTYRAELGASNGASVSLPVNPSSAALWFDASGTGLVRPDGGAGQVPYVPTLTLELASTNSFLDQLQDGTWIGTSNDATGGFGGQLWTATGTLAAPVRTARTVTSVAALRNAAGTLLGSGTIDDAWALPDGNMLFAGRSASRSYLFFALNTAGTWTVGNNSPAFDNGRPVLEMGERSGVHPANIRALHHRSICVANVAGSTVLLFGEYNVASGRVPGSTNDQVRLWRSTDIGRTWSILCEWNTNGSTTQTRHIHGVVQDPITRLIYILHGDDPTSGILRWDGVSAAPPANTSLANYANFAGWASLSISGANADFYRAGDLIFSGDYGAYLIDRAAAGFNRPRTISRAGPLSVRAHQPHSIEAGRDPLIGIALPGGGGFWLSLWDTTVGGTRGFTVWSSADCREWVNIGQLQDVGTTGTAAVITNVFWTRDGKIVVTNCNGFARLVAGAYGGSLVFNADSTWSGIAGNLS